MLKLIDGEEKVQMPRLVERQKNRTNIIVLILQSSEVYFRIAIAIHFYDDFIQQLKDRFLKHKSVLSSLYLVFKKNVP